ncbi:hypothetical protein HYV50_04935 [Candidatus Pacearchaeota archaeon]|nr:hypothetical protein [Candidatus Pacearchaeota archaeon]
MVEVNAILTPGAIFLGALIVVLIAIITLTMIERKLSKRIGLKKEEQENFFKIQIEYIKNIQHPQQFLFSLDDLARQFFTEKFGIEKQMKYSDMIEKLQDKRAVEFCERMQEALYSGETLDRDKLNYLLENIESMIEEEEKKKEAIKPKIEIPQRAEQKGELNYDIVRYLVEGKKLGVKTELLIEKLIKKGLNKDEIIRAVDYVNSIKKEPSVNFSILRYLDEGRRKGIGIELLKEKLIDGGFDKNEVEKAIQYLGVVELKTENTGEQEKTNEIEKYSEHHRFIGGVDNLERVKRKIATKRRAVTPQEAEGRIGIV